MNIDNLIRQANRIGAFFQAMPDRREGEEGIVNHIQKFWEPRMRRAFLEFLERHPDGVSANAALDDIVRSAVLQHKERLTPTTSSPP